MRCEGYCEAMLSALLTALSPARTLFFTSYFTFEFKLRAVLMINPLILRASPTGFEPVTPRLGIWCSILLSYEDMPIH